MISTQLTALNLPIPRTIAVHAAQLVETSPLIRDRARAQVAARMSARGSLLS